MKLYSIENIPGASYEVLGIVSGSTIQSKNFLSDFGQSLKSIVGGELKSYTAMMEKARAKATDRMIEQASSMGADAIIGVRYTTSFKTKTAKTEEDVTEENINRKYIRFWAKHDIRKLCNMDNINVEVKDILKLKED